MIGQAFEQAGFKNAIKALALSKDALDLD